MIWIVLLSAFISGYLFGISTPSLIRFYVRWRARLAAKKAGVHWTAVLDKAEVKETARKSVSFEVPKSEDFPIETLSPEEVKEWEKKMDERLSAKPSEWAPKPNQWVPTKKD